MTRKDYINLAAVIRRMKPPSGGDRWHAGIVALCDILKHDNPAFDAVRFRAACGADVRGPMPLDYDEDKLKWDIVQYHSGRTEGGE